MVRYGENGEFTCFVHFLLASGLVFRLFIIVQRKALSENHLFTLSGGFWRSSIPSLSDMIGQMILINGSSPV